MLLSWHFCVLNVSVFTSEVCLLHCDEWRCCACETCRVAASVLHEDSCGKGFAIENGEPCELWYDFRCPSSHKYIGYFLQLPEAFVSSFEKSDILCKARWLLEAVFCW